MSNLERNGKWFRQIRSIIVAIICLVLILTGNVLWAVAVTVSAYLVGKAILKNGE